MYCTGPHCRAVIGDGAGGTLALHLATDHADSMRIAPLAPELGSKGFALIRRWHRRARCCGPARTGPSTRTLPGPRR